MGYKYSYDWLISTMNLQVDYTTSVSSLGPFKGISLGCSGFRVQGEGPGASGRGFRV